MAKVVVADDDADVRAVFSRLLAGAGHEVCEAADGLEALDLIRSARPDLLVLDLWMPRVNGFEVLDSLRHDPNASRLGVIMLSNLSDADSRLESFGGGAVEYLVKGIGLADFLESVESVLRRTAVVAESA